jgi:hypothetical protein
VAPLFFWHNEGELWRAKSMANEVYTKVIALVNLLTAAEREVLIQHLQEKITDKALDESLSREMILAEHEQLKAAGAFDNVESLRGNTVKLSKKMASVRF